MATPPLHHFLQTMIQTQTTNHDKLHQQRRRRSSIATTDQQGNLKPYCCWTVASDNASSHSAKRRVQWSGDDCRTSTTSAIVDSRWGNSSWSSNQEYSAGRQWASATNSTSPCGREPKPTRTRSSSIDCFLTCPKRRESLEADQMVALLTTAMDVYQDN